jgi:signal transduction histidine kinase/CheY-like chemotaxis protein
MSESLRVLVVDDTPDIRMLLKVALRAIGNFDVVGEAADGAEAVRLSAELQPDAVLLDLAMPVMDGLQATPEIRRCSPETRIVILSGFSKDRLADDAIAAGADAYIEKGTSPKQIAQIVEDVCATPRAPQPDPIQPEVDEPVVDPRGGGGLEAWRRRIAMAVGHVGELAGAFTSFGHTVRARVAFDQAGFGLSEDGGFRLAAVCGGTGGVISPGALFPVPSAHAASLDRGTTITVDDTDAVSDAPLDRYLLNLGIRSYAAVPVRAAGRAQAVVAFASERAGAFGTEEVDYLDVAVREAAAAFHILWSMGHKTEIASAEATDQARREWNRIIRHDLRSPLTVISGFAETMREAWADLPDAEKLDFVDAIARGANAMTTLLSDMEQVDRLESGGVGSAERRPIDLGALVEQTVKDITSSNGRIVVRNVAPDLPLALADDGDQRRVISNLLENAFKFSCPTEVVEVRVFASGGMIHVSVKDQGRGIAEEDQAKLFQKFSRVGHGNGARVPGSGLGLFICRSIIESHGGRIWVESAPHQGSTFHYTTPADALAA